MNEIKFRQWLGEKFHYWGFLKDGVFIGPVGNPDEAKKDSQQFIGLKDKQGKEIFEGDIVKGITTGRTEYILEIIFEGIMWIGRKADKDIEVLDDFGDWPNYNLEVIGNIHENPELLEEVKD